jgi:hypothetical protein
MMLDERIRVGIQLISGIRALLELNGSQGGGSGQVIPVIDNAEKK